MSYRRCTASLILSSSKHFSVKNIPCAQASGKKAFTLVELLISIIILSFLMTALYKSYASLNASNSIYKNKSDDIKSIELKRKTIYLDLSLAIPKSLIYLDRDTKKDIISFQTINSVHKRFNPYITYIVKDSILYRLESLTKIKIFPFNSDFNGNVDNLGEVDEFKIYKSKSKSDESYLVNIVFKNNAKILLKVKVLSQKD